MPETTAPPSMRPLWRVAALVTLVAVAGTLVLWAYYGTAVFFETIRAGFVACFG
jgi:hypothetical protein